MGDAALFVCAVNFVIYIKAFFFKFFCDGVCIPVKKSVCFIGKEGPFTYGENGIEALSGATVTSNAVLKALNQAFPGAEPAAEEQKEDAKPAEEAGRVYYGSYTAKRETNFSTIKVMINSKGGKITDCKITSEAKMEGSDFLTDEIKDTWAKTIVENGTADVDAITSATLKISSGAVVDAVNEILGRIQ